MIEFGDSGGDDFGDNEGEAGGDRLRSGGGDVEMVTAVEKRKVREKVFD